MPALFSLGVNDITKSVDAEFNTWFLDDCMNRHSPEKAIENVLTVLKKLRLAGLELNNSKCELVILENQSTAEATGATEVFQEIVSDKKTLKNLKILLLAAPLIED